MKQKDKITVNEFFKNQSLEKRKEALEELFANIIRKSVTNDNK